MKGCRLRGACGVLGLIVEGLGRECGVLVLEILRCLWCPQVEDLGVCLVCVPVCLGSLGVVRCPWCPSLRAWVVSGIPHPMLEGLWEHCSVRLFEILGCLWCPPPQFENPDMSLPPPHHEALEVSGCLCATPSPS